MAKIPVNNFDKFIKNKVEWHQTPVDTQRLWSNIKSTGQSKRTGMLPGALLLLLILIFVNIHVSNNTKSLLNEDSLKIGQINNISFVSENIEHVHSKADNNIYLNNSSHIIVNAENPAPEKSDQAEKQSSSMKTGAQIQLNNNLNSEGEELTQVLSEENVEFVLSETIGRPSNVISNSGEQFVLAQMNALFLTESHSPTFVQSENESADFGGLAGLSSAQIKDLETDPYMPEMTFFTFHSSRIQPEQFKKGFDLRLNAGVGKVFRKMTLLNPEAGNWMQSRMESEHQLEAVRWGMELKFKISKNVYFFAGLEDFRINERFDYSFLEKRTFTKEGQVARLVFDINSYSVEQGPVEIQEEIRKEGIFYNQLRMINIPFGVGVSQRMGKFSMGLEAAILINAFSDFDGKIADASNVLVELKDAGMRVNQIQTARINGVFSYQLSPQWGINFVTGADLPLKSIQLGQHMAQNYLVFQGNIGVCYYW